MSNVRRRCLAGLARLLGPAAAGCVSPGDSDGETVYEHTDDGFRA